VKLTLHECGFWKFYHTTDGGMQFRQILSSHKKEDKKKQILTPRIWDWTHWTCGIMVITTAFQAVYPCSIHGTFMCMAVVVFCDNPPLLAEENTTALEASTLASSGRSTKLPTYSAFHTVKCNLHDMVSHREETPFFLDQTADLSSPRGRKH
jgi:hypothetical protein